MPRQNVNFQGINMVQGTPMYTGGVPLEVIDQVGTSLSNAYWTNYGLYKDTKTAVDSMEVNPYSDDEETKRAISLGIDQQVKDMVKDDNWWGADVKMAAMNTAKELVANKGLQKLAESKMMRDSVLQANNESGHDQSTIAYLNAYNEMLDNGVKYDPTTGQATGGYQGRKISQYVSLADMNKTITDTLSKFKSSSVSAEELYDAGSAFAGLRYTDENGNEHSITDYVDPVTGQTVNTLIAKYGQSQEGIPKHVVEQWVTSFLMSDPKYQASVRDVAKARLIQMQTDPSRPFTEDGKLNGYNPRFTPEMFVQVAGGLGLDMASATKQFFDDNKIDFNKYYSTNPKDDAYRQEVLSNLNVQSDSQLQQLIASDGRVATNYINKEFGVRGIDLRDPSNAGYLESLYVESFLRQEIGRNAGVFGEGFGYSKQSQTVDTVRNPTFDAVLAGIRRSGSGSGSGSDKWLDPRVGGFVEQSVTVPSSHLYTVRDHSQRQHDLDKNNAEFMTQTKALSEARPLFEKAMATGNYRDVNELLKSQGFGGYDTNNPEDIKKVFDKWERDNSDLKLRIDSEEDKLRREREAALELIGDKKINVSRDDIFGQDVNRNYFKTATSVNNKILENVIDSFILSDEADKSKGELIDKTVSSMMSSFNNLNSFDEFLESDINIPYAGTISDSPIAEHYQYKTKISDVLDTNNSELMESFRQYYDEKQNEFITQVANQAIKKGVDMRGGVTHYTPIYTEDPDVAANNNYILEAVKHGNIQGRVIDSYGSNRKLANKYKGVSTNEVAKLLDEKDIAELKIDLVIANPGAAGLSPDEQAFVIRGLDETGRAIVNTTVAVRNNSLANLRDNQFIIASKPAKNEQALRMQALVKQDMGRRDAVTNVYSRPTFKGDIGTMDIKRLGDATRLMSEAPVGSTIELGLTNTTGGRNGNYGLEISRQNDGFVVKYIFSDTGNKDTNNKAYMAFRQAAYEKGGERLLNRLTGATKYTNIEDLNEDIVTLMGIDAYAPPGWDPSTSNYYEVPIRRNSQPK